MTAEEIDNSIAQLREIYTPETEEEKQIQETFIATLRAALVDKEPQAIATLKEFIKYAQSKVRQRGNNNEYTKENNHNNIRTSPSWISWQNGLSIRSYDNKARRD